jgi:putative membrane protein
MYKNLEVYKMDFTGLLYGVMDTVIYSLVGIILMGLGFLLINFFTPFSVKKEIEDDQNTSLGIIIGAVIIGISIIVASVIMSPSGSYSSKRAVSEQTDMQK